MRRPADHTDVKNTAEASEPSGGAGTPPLSNPFRPNDESRTMRHRTAFLLLATSLLLLTGDLAAQRATGNGLGQVAPFRATRRFHIRYEVEANRLPRGQDLRAWIPIPSDDPWQRIHNLEVVTDLPWEIQTEEVYGNRMVYIDTRIDARTARVRVEYDVDRRFRKTDFSGEGGACPLTENEMKRYLAPSRLVVVDARILEQSRKITAGKSDPVEKARAIYNFVLAKMTYGKPKNLPWGRGDTRFACDARVGNCTDFHSWFISLCRAAKIPARFQIGLFGRYETKRGEEYATGGYHCWAEFYTPRTGWVPVDISEADKHPDRAAEFFGIHTDNRVTLSTGRDIVLAPRQVGPPLNFFVSPYAEVDGLPFSNIKKTSYWRDL